MKKRENKLYKYLCIVLVLLLLIMIFLYFHDKRKYFEKLNNTEAVADENVEVNKNELQKYMTNNTLASSQNALYAIKKDGTVIATNMLITFDQGAINHMEKHLKKILYTVQV